MMSLRTHLENSIASVQRHLSRVPPEDPFHAELLRDLARLEKQLAAVTPEAEVAFEAEVKRELAEEEELYGTDEDEDEDERS